MSCPGTIIASAPRLVSPLPFQISKYIGIENFFHRCYTVCRNTFGLIMAGSALASVPIIIVFIIFQKYFTKGITMGAVKG